MTNSAQLKDRKLRMLVLFLLIILEICSLLALECATSICFFRKTVGLGKNPLKICKTVRNEEPTVRP